MAYVIAHEVGHHIQNELGTLQSYQKAIRGKSETVKKMPSMSVWNFKLTTMRVCGLATLKNKASWRREISKKRSMLPMPWEMIPFKNKPMATPSLIASPTGLLNNACAGSNVATNTATLNTEIPSASPMKTCNETKTKAFQIII